MRCVSLLLIYAIILIETLTFLNRKTFLQKYFITFIFDRFYVCVDKNEQ